MRVDRETDVGGIGAHFDRERGLGDQIACRRPNDAAADNPLVFLVEQDLGDAFIPAKRQRASARRPRKNTLAVLDAFGLGFDLGEANPGHFRDRYRQPRE